MAQRSISASLNHYYDRVKNRPALYLGALVLEGIVLTVLWLVGRHFTTP